jgi:hypothetical protein
MRPPVPCLKWSVLLLASLAACDAGTPAGPDPDPAGDPQLAIGGTPGKTTDQIQINLDVQPDGPQDIGFKVGGAKTATLMMDDDSDPTLPNIRVLPSLKPGIYTVTMGALPVGYSLSQINCVSFANGGSGTENTSTSFNFSTVTIIIPLEKLEREVCTFVVARPPDELTVTINQAAIQADPGQNGLVYFDVTFSGGVADFDASDVALGGGASASVVSVTQTDGFGAQYRVAVSAFQGEVTATIPAGVATDGFGNLNQLSTSWDNSVLVGILSGCFDENGNPMPVCI